MWGDPPADGGEEGRGKGRKTRSSSSSSHASYQRCNYHLKTEASIPAADASICNLALIKMES